MTLLGLHSLSRPLLRRPSLPILIRTYTAKPPRPGPANSRLPATTQAPPNTRPPTLGPKVPKGNPQKKSARLPNPIGGAPSKKDFSIPATLGAKDGPTLLYAHHPNLFLVGCYGLAGLSVGWCVYTYNLDRSGIGLPEWVGKVHYFGIAMMGLLAGGCLFYPTRIIQKIYAVPNTSRKGISIVLHRRPYLPFLPCKKITIESPEGLSLEREFQSLVEVKEEKAGAREVGWVEGITSAPRRGLDLVKRMVSSKDFVGLKMRDGGGYLLHEKGWCWERRGLDRLFGGGGQRYQ